MAIKRSHFAQGFVPAILAREILLLNAVVNGRGWLNLFVISICFAFSALYELFEWGVAVATGDSAESFLGTQGYMWDTQSDMAMALLGAVTALTILSKVHDWQLTILEKRVRLSPAVVEEFSRLKSKYRNDKRVVSKLNEYEAQIEPSSKK